LLGRWAVGHSAKSAAVRERAILVLLSENNIGEADAKSAVNEKTMRRWLLNAESFKAEYVAARQAAFQAGIHRMQALTARAVDTLRLLDAKKYPSDPGGPARRVSPGVRSRVTPRNAERINRRVERQQVFPHRWLAWCASHATPQSRRGRDRFALPGLWPPWNLTW
jgi:hypothetical protein